MIGYRRTASDHLNPTSAQRCAELLAYLKHVAHTHKLLEPPPGQTKPLVRLNTEVTEARWDEAAQRWVVQAVNNGETMAGRRSRLLE